MSQDLRMLSRVIRLRVPVTRERQLFDAPMNPSLFNSLNRSALGVRKARLHSAFWKRPTTASSLDQEKLDAFLPLAVADCSHLLS
jgi:hypothetical protein